MLFNNLVKELVPLRASVAGGAVFIGNHLIVMPTLTMTRDLIRGLADGTD
jgi:hypothetical protein